jgi:lipopolysaccharide biosynthesis regulator YciM
VPQLVHYYCEQAQAALQSKPPRMEQARQALDQAQRASATAQTSGVSASFVRVAMLNAMVAAAENNLPAQRQHLLTVLDQAPEYAGLIAQELLNNFTQTQEEKLGLQVLQNHYQQYPSLDLFNVVFRAARAQNGADQAWAFARDTLQAHPSLLGLDRLLEAELAQAPAGRSPEDSPIPGADLTLLRRLIHKHTQRMDRYACRTCGFQAKRYYWQCPGCNAWETYKPRRLEELE